MFSRTFTYKGYDGNEHKETWWFNLSESELMKMELGSVGGINGMMNRMLREDHPDKIVDMFEKIILGSVGERSADGRRFLKRGGAVAEDFRETPAYDQLFLELVSSGEALATFLKGAIPEEVRKNVEKAEAEQAKRQEESAAPELKALPKEEPVSDALPHEHEVITKGEGNAVH